MKKTIKKYLKSFAIAIAIIVWSTTVSADGPLSNLGIPRWSATTGFINPTVATFNVNKPMRCTASTTPGAPFTEQNRAAFQAAITLASSTKQWVYLPPCEIDVLNSNTPCPTNSLCGYPISKKAGSICGVDFSGLSFVNIVGNGAIIRQYASPNGAAEYDMVCVRGTSHIKFIGVWWSQRDVTGSTTEQVHTIELGSGTLVADDVLIYHNRFIEPVAQAIAPAVNKGGDCIRVLGSTPPSTNTRINVIENDMRCRRSSLSIQRGFQYINFVGNTTFGVTDQDIDYEPTSEGLIHNLVATNNIFDRRGSPNDITVTLGGASSTSLSVGTVIADNIFIEGSITESLNAAQIWIRNNHMTSGISRADSSPNIYLFRRVLNMWVTNNYIYRGHLALSNDMIAISHQAPNCAGAGPDCKPQNIWINGNRIEQHAPITSGSEDGVRLDSVIDAWVDENNITYHGAQGDVAANGPLGLNVQNTGDTGSSGWFVGNRVKRDVQEDGVTPAGRLLTGVLFNTGLQTLGHFTVRDNIVEGSKSIMFDNASTMAQLPAGPTVFSGNVGFLTGTATAEILSGGLVTTESFHTIDHIIGSGAVSPSTTVSHLIGTCGADVLTLPACEIDGLIKTFTTSYAGCVNSASMSVAGFGDGTSLSWVLAGSSPVSFRLVCDLVASTWWILDKSSAVTVVP